MSDPTGWYARRLAQQQPQRPQPYAPINRNLPQPVPTAYRQPQQQPQQWQPPEAPPENFSEALERSQGWQGKAHKLNPDPCPQCGGPHYNEQMEVGRRGPQPAGHCFTCGYNGGMFQQGQASSWNATA